MTECTLGQCPPNEQCVTEIIQNPIDDTIYGNFMNFATKKKITQKELKKILNNLKIKGKCLTVFPGKKGGIKQSYTFLIDNEYKKYILLMETIEPNNLETSIKNIKKELSLQQKVWKSYPLLTPKVYTANIFKENDKIVVQTIMDNVLTDGYEELTEYPFMENLLLFTFTENLSINEENSFFETMNKIKSLFIKKGQKWNTKGIENTLKIFTNIDEVLKQWWNENCVLLSFVFNAIHKIHELGILHNDITLKNVFYKQYNENEFGIKMIDYGLSCTVNEWCQEWKKNIKNNPFIEDSRKAYNDLSRTLSLKKNSPNWLKAMMMAEMTNFSKQIQINKKTVNTIEYNFFRNIFHNIEPLDLFYNLFASYQILGENSKELLIQFNNQTRVVIKNFIVERYSETITEILKDK